jgi:hypothetical protein
VIKKILFLVAALTLTIFPLTAQSFLQDSLAAATHHHTPWDILSGKGEDTIVCYKQAHRNMYFVVTGLIIIIAIVAIRLLQLNRKNNRLLKAQNDLIEEKNKNITDSINYAKRIQNAQLTPERYIERELARLKKNVK